LRKDRSAFLAKAAAGFVAGVVLWWTLATPYTVLLATIAQPLIRMFERPVVTRLIADGTEMTIDRADFPPSSPRPALEVMDLTANVILLTTLFAANPRPVRDRNIRALFFACLSLVPVHVLAVIVNVQSIYALRLGPWSAANYGAFARNFWGAGAHFYTLIGAFGAAFALWWLFRPTEKPR
jgi:hypothetical protein